MATAILFSDIAQLQGSSLPETAVTYFQQQFTGDTLSSVYKGTEGVFFAEKTGKLKGFGELERLRKAGSAITNATAAEKHVDLQIINAGADAEHALALAEGAILGSYKFEKYKKEAATRFPAISMSEAGSEGLAELQTLAASVFKARDLVNEPVNHLSSEELAASFVKMGEEAGFSVEVWNKSKIESQKMGGILAVNAGSQQPPTFSIMEYKPASATNTKPIVLVGKGVVFDTGGLSLKPTPNSMDHMKSDMGGSAAVAGIMHAAASLKLPLWLIALVPSTDNRPGENATCPGDIITMYDGTTVEVLNTDAEGRLILGDALAFAKKYDPELVLDFATLTGAALRALGTYGSAMMGTAPDDVKNKIKQAGEKVYERLAELPLWEEYFEDTKGEISDLKNLGKAEGGAQSAAMFLRYFTDYPWLHFDIAGTAFLHGAEGYRPKGGTGVGIRLIIEFLKDRSNGK